MPYKLNLLNLHRTKEKRKERGTSSREKYETFHRPRTVHFHMKHPIKNILNRNYKNALCNIDRVYFDHSIHSIQSQLFTFSNSDKKTTCFTCFINWIYWISTEWKKKKKKERGTSRREKHETSHRPRTVHMKHQTKNILNRNYKNALCNINRVYLDLSIHSMKYPVTTIHLFQYWWK